MNDTALTIIAACLLLGIVVTTVFTANFWSYVEQMVDRKQSMYETCISKCQCTQDVTPCIETCNDIALDEIYMFELKW